MMERAGTIASRDREAGGQGPVQRTEVSGVIVCDALSSQLLHRLGPESDEESPEVDSLEDLEELVLGLRRREYPLVLDGSDDDCLWRCQWYCTSTRLCCSRPSITERLGVGGTTDQFLLDVVAGNTLVRHRQDLLRLVDLASLDEPPWHGLVWC
jgi:hypothetical protein